MTIWGGAPNGRDIAIGMDWEVSNYSPAWNTPRVTVTVIVTFRANYSTYDTTNTLSFFGDAGALGGPYSRALNWTSARKGTVELKRVSFDVDLITGQPQNRYVGARLSGIENAGGDLAVGGNIYIPARPHGVGQVTLSNTNFTMGETVTIYPNRMDGSHYVKMLWVFGDARGWVLGNSNIVQQIGSANWSTSIADMAPYIPNVTKGWGTVWCYYFDGAQNYIGESSVDFIANYPTGNPAYGPNVGSMSLSEDNPLVTSVMGAMPNKFVQGNSSIKATLGGESGKHGASVSTEIVIDGAVSPASGSTFTTSTIWGLPSSVTKRVRDSRGMVAEYTVPITVLPYRKPTINNFSAIRCNSDGTENPGGVYAKLRGTISSASLINGTEKNKLNYQITHTNIDTGEKVVRGITNVSGIAHNLNEIVNSIFPAADAHNFEISVGDAFQTNFATKTNSSFVMSAEIVPFSIGKTGIGAGKAWDRGAIDVKGDVLIEGNLILSDGRMFGGIGPTDITDKTPIELSAYGAGTYIQRYSANCTPQYEYPTPHAGILEVITETPSPMTSNFVYQRYTVYSGAPDPLGSAAFTRGKYNGTWGPWKMTLGDNAKPMARILKTNGFQLLDGSQQITMSNNTMMNGMTFVNWGGGGIMVPIAATYRYDLRMYLTGSSQSMGGGRIALWRGGNFIMRYPNAMTYKADSQDYTATISDIINLSAGDVLCVEGFSSNNLVSTWGTSDGAGTSLTVTMA